METTDREASAPLPPTRQRKATPPLHEILAYALNSANRRGGIDSFSAMLDEIFPLRQGKCGVQGVLKKGVFAFLCRPHPRIFMVYAPFEHLIKVCIWVDEDPSTIEAPVEEWRDFLGGNAMESSHITPAYSILIDLS